MGCSAGRCGFAGECALSGRDVLPCAKRDGIRGVLQRVGSARHRRPARKRACVQRRRVLDALESLRGCGGERHRCARGRSAAACACYPRCARGVLRIRRTSLPPWQSNAVLSRRCRRPLHSTRNMRSASAQSTVRHRRTARMIQFNTIARSNLCRGRSASLSTEICMEGTRRQAAVPADPSAIRVILGRVSNRKDCPWACSSPPRAPSAPCPRGA